ncbi:hypothetical protein Acr_14g0005920 [Actinidia rufa]|uniref:Protein kinase domain-containing protein n=1 Tax=Actinidia rufa TaxID=165716 RepID=A0A7J0FRD1_9ERIC|nr:hypothetical protein Acr_14g0005920 [Actinidia rufa]
MCSLSLKMFAIYCTVIVVQLSRNVVMPKEISDYYPGERAALLQLRETLNSTANLHAIWTGPPCHRNKSRWAGIACWNGHITHLVLDSIQLTGSLPQPTFLQNITFLSKLSSRNNSIHGPLPDLTNLAYLELVLLSQNRFSVWSIGLIAAAAALVPFFVMLVFLCYYRRAHGKEPKGDQSGKVSVKGRAKKRRYWSENTENPERTVKLEFFDKERTVFDLDDLLRASAEVMGKGKLGTTYKAMLESGPAVAVKRIKDINALIKKEFVQQMHLLGNMRHENLVEIICFYYSSQEKLVVYEFVPDGSLFEILHEENRGVDRVPLNWTARLLSKKQRKHDGQNYHSKLTDFGFLPLLPSRKSSEKLVIGKSREFSQGKKLTYKADVYCFGIILLEVITGKIPGEISEGNEATVDDLSDWVRSVVNNDWSTDIFHVEILSAREEHDEMLILTEIALKSTDMMPEKRPKMSEVLRRIEEMSM